jgi:hypothetical protein
MSKSGEQVNAGPDKKTTASTAASSSSADWSLESRSKSSRLIALEKKIQYVKT